MTFVSPFHSPFVKPFPSEGAVALVYLLRDEFLTDEAAPMVTPRTCEPGPGTLTIVDPSTVIAITSGRILVGGASVGWVYSSQNRAAGRMFSCRHYATTNTNVQHGWLDSGANVYGILQWGLRIRVQTASITGLPGLSPAVPYNFFSVLRSAGSFIGYDSTLLWVDSVDTVSPLRAGSRQTGSGIYEWFRIADLGTPWNTAYGLATDRKETVASGDTITQEADALVEFTWPAATGVTLDMMVRRTDDNNCWIVRCSQGGSTIKLIEKNGGVETERASAAQTWTNGTSYRIVAICAGNTICTVVDTSQKNSYASATFNNTATVGKVDQSGSNLISWPRTLSGAALTELQRWTV